MGQTRSIFLYPVSVIYGFLTGFRNFLYNSGILHSTEFNVPVICVGNITVGGTGKTPHTEYLVGLLGKSFRVATLSRGYKRKTRDFRIASASASVSEIGDEPMQIFRKYPGTFVTVDRNRVNGVNRIMAMEPQTDVIILDDGFQHRQITPGFSILLSDFERPFLKDHMLPYGNLREDRINIRRADIILITKCPENLTPLQRRLIVKDVEKAPYQNLYFTTLRYNLPLPLFESRDEKITLPPMIPGSGAGIVLVTGIANPKPFREYLHRFFAEIIQLEYPDHYNYKEKDLAAISAAYSRLRSDMKFVITTEKDSVRLREFTNIAEPVRSAFFYVPVGIYFLNNDKDEFDNLIVDYVRKNRRDNRIS
jgi:tetraacyldisaccharide 4'-kinase